MILTKWLHQEFFNFDLSFLNVTISHILRYIPAVTDVFSKDCHMKGST